MLSPLVAIVATAGPAAAGDAPAGFWYGGDSGTCVCTGSGVPYGEEYTGGAYGGYFGQVGAYWNDISSCPQPGTGWNPTAATKADDNWDYGYGTATWGVWYLGGPGVDPDYNGTTTEAGNWGYKQGESFMLDILTKSEYQNIVIAPVMFADIEPGPDAGWNEVYSNKCWEPSGVISNYVPTSVDRADLNGFFDAVTAYYGTDAVYSSTDWWESVFGTGSDGTLNGVYEYTFQPVYDGNPSPTASPAGWCMRNQPGTCASFFGGINSSSTYALAWQWSAPIAGGNTVGKDLDQIDNNHCSAFGGC